MVSGCPDLGLSNPAVSSHCVHWISVAPAWWRANAHNPGGSSSAATPHKWREHMRTGWTRKNNIDIMAQTNNGQSHCRKSNVELFVIVFVWPKHDRNCMQHQKTAKCDEPCPCNYGSQHLSTLHTKNESFLGILINKPPCLPAGHFRVQARVQLAVERDLLKLFHIVPQVHPWWFVWFHRCSFHPS